MEHFGVTVNPGKYGLKICRETYAIINNKSSFGGKLSGLEHRNAYADEFGEFYTQTWCEEYKELCLQNYDLNMKYFSLLDHDEFEKELCQFLRKHPRFKQVSDLKKYEGVGGYYVMVLDGYCQVYIGTTNNIKKRIQQHWTKKKSFDRLLFPMYAVNKSVLSIDSFRALDTTRIYALPSTSTYVSENRYLKEFSPKFSSNRIGGGRIEKGIVGLIQMVSTVNNRDLNRQQK